MKEGVLIAKCRENCSRLTLLSANGDAALRSPEAGPGAPPPLSDARHWLTARRPENDPRPDRDLLGLVLVETRC